VEECGKLSFVPLNDAIDTIKIAGKGWDVEVLGFG
jgi:hypothetical protein